MTATFHSSGDLAADRRFEWARASLAQGDFAAAADLLTQALDRVPDYAAGWFLLGEAREKLDDRAGAIAAFGRARAADPQDRHGATLHLIRLGAEPADARPWGMPQAYVRALFDGYAPRFERALVGSLRYNGPALLRDAVLAQGHRQFDTMLDLGCGTGLAGVAFRPVAALIVGVDLSPAMLAQARAKGLYDRLAEMDLVTFLRREAAEGLRYQLVVAADVLIYLDELASVMRGVVEVLAPGGLFAFTAETHDGEGALLRETLRYAHGTGMVRDALASAGLMPLTLEPAAVRTERGVPVPGLVCVATSAG